MVVFVYVGEESGACTICDENSCELLAIGVSVASTESRSFMGRVIFIGKSILGITILTFPQEKGSLGFDGTVEVMFHFGACSGSVLIADIGGVDGILPVIAILDSSEGLGRST